MVQNLRAYLVLYAIKIKWIMCVQEKNEVLSMPQRQMFSSIEISGDASLATKKKQQNKVQKKFPGVAKRWHPVTQGWHLPPHGYGPGKRIQISLLKASR